MYENNYKTLNLITTALDMNVYVKVSHLKLLTMSGLNYEILMRAFLILSLCVEILTICNIKLSLKNLMNP
jgi:hypothetical protein